MKLALVTDLLDSLNLKKDTSLALAYAAKGLGCTVYFIEYNQLYFSGDGVKANAYRVEDISHHVQEVIDEGVLGDYLRLSDPVTLSAQDLDIVFMRKDPPVDASYWAVTYLLKLWEDAGVLVENSTRILRNFNEKCAILSFPELITDTVVTSNLSVMKEFLKKLGCVILKPLDAMGGLGILKLYADDPDLHATFLTATRNQTVPVMLQRVLNLELTGDKRIILFHGIPLPYLLLRHPAPGDFRANLAAGGSGVVVELTQEDRQLADAVARGLPIDELGLIGLDVIDGRITEINVTSPTGLREIQQHAGENYARDYVKKVISKVS
jgi:glutathione synthase